MGNEVKVNGFGNSDVSIGVYLVPEMKIAEFANSVDLDEMAH